MAYSINTNIASLLAQEYLRISSDFQQKTINRVTSGLRIVASGDDAAGLAVANSIRSDRAVLTQGVRNANDGLSTLQTIDGGLNNISHLLDRARTLAAQSASGTFTGDRSLLNSEFQSVLSEIDRQAQAIGLNVGGAFAKNLGVFIGGGRGPSSSAQVANGTISVNLSSSTVDAKSLGLKGVQVVGVAGTDIGASAPSTSVAAILANTTNQNSQRTAGYVDFYFYGPGFGDSNRVKVSVNTSGVTDAATLATALNDAIAAAANGSSASATAFKDANIVASANTDSAGRQQLAFSSSAASFQVKAGDRTANALLGNYTSASDATGKALTTNVTGAANTASGSATFGSAGAGDIVFRFQGGGLTSPLDITVTVASATTVNEAIASLSSQVLNHATLAAAGITLTSAEAGSPLAFTSTSGERFHVQVTGDKLDRLGFGSFIAGSGAAFDYATITGAAYNHANSVGTARLEFSINGAASSGNSVAIDLTAGDATAASITGSNTSATVDLSGGGGVNLLRLVVDGTAYQVTLGTTNAEQKSVIANTINSDVGANIASVVNNAIVLTSTTKGANSSIQVLGGGAATTLGLSTTPAFGNGRSASSIVDALNAAFAADTEMTAAALRASASGGQITIQSNNGTYFRVNPRGSAETAATTTGATGSSGNFTITADNNDKLLLTVDGTAYNITLTAGARSAAQIVSDINTAVGASVASVVTAGSTNYVKLASTTTGASSSLLLTATANSVYSTLGLTAGTYSGKTGTVGFGVGGATFAGNIASDAPAASAQFNAGGSSQSSALSFTEIAYGGDDQTITLSANDAAGFTHSLSILLRNDATSRIGRNIDQAINYINTQLQQTNNSTLKQLVAVKTNDEGTEKIQFVSALASFRISVGSTANSTGVGSQGATDTSSVSAGGSWVAIDTQAGGEAAGSTLAASVTLLGAVQAVVGKGQNQFNFAINLAQTQLNNLAASESRIRDADLAAEAANLTRAQILQQAGIAALAQANVATQVVLSLLRG